MDTVRCGGRDRQKGVVLFIALILLVVMTIGGLALMRSVDTTTLVAGNLAFQQSASLSAEHAAEQAIAWLNTQTDTTLQNDILPGYRAAGAASGNQPQMINGKQQSWSEYWDTTLKSGVATAPVDLDTKSGNRASWVIDRLCLNPGDHNTPSTGCMLHETQSSQLNSHAAGQSPPPKGIGRPYFRITLRVEGPRNAVSMAHVVIYR